MDVEVPGTWYPVFFQRLTEGVAVDEIETLFRNVSFIVFNYDRCIEKFLPLALRRYYGILLERARTLVNSAIIHHPYGTVGKLPWQNTSGNGIEFGGDEHGDDDLLGLAGQIKAFY